MKKFFRTLALVLALTLVIGCIPAAAADEVKPVSKKTLYVDGAKGTTEAGKKSTYKAKVALYKLAGYATKEAAATAEISAKVENSKIATASEKYVYAQAIGKTTIILTVDGKDTKIALTVKKNASDETFEVKGLEEKYTVGQTAEFTLPRAGVDTDARRVSVNGTALKEVEGKARTYSYKFDKAGEYEFLCEAYQGSKYNAATAKKTIKVTAADPKAVEVKQASLNSFQITFDVDVDGVITKSSFPTGAVYSKAGTAVVPFSIVKDVKVDKDNKKLVTVTMYTNFAAKTEYFVNFGGEQSFVGCGSKIEDVDRIEIKTTKATVQKATEIKYAYYNALNVDITANLTAYVPTFTIEKGDDVWMYSAKEIYFMDVDKVATVKASLQYAWDEATYAPLYRYDTKDIVSAPVASAELTGSLYSVVATTSAIGTSKAYDKPVAHEFRIGSPAYLAGQFTYAEEGKSTPTYKTIADYLNVNGTGYKFVSADETIVMLANNQTGELVGVNPGKTVILGYAKNATGNDYTLVDGFEVEVKEGRKPVDFTVTIDKTQLNGTDTSTDKVTVTVKVVDQDGNGIFPASGKEPKIAQNENNKNAVNVTVNPLTLTAAADKEGVYTVEITGALVGTATEVKQIVLEVKTDAISNLTKNISFTVVDKANTSGNNHSISATANELDVALVKADPNAVSKSAVITINSNYNGYYTATEGFVILTKTPGATVTSDAIGVSTGSATYAIYPTLDGKYDNFAKAITAGSITTGTGVTITSIQLTNLVPGKQLKTGTYQFTAYRIEWNNDGSIKTYSNLGTEIVKVKDSTVLPTVELLAEKFTAPYANNTTETEKLFKTTFGDVSTYQYKIGDPNKNYIEAGDTGNINVISIKVTFETAIYGDKEFTLNVGKKIEKKP